MNINFYPASADIDIPCSTVPTTLLSSWVLSCADDYQLLNIWLKVFPMVSCYSPIKSVLYHSLLKLLNSMVKLFILLL